MMLAYHSDPRIKMRVLSQLLRHAQADEIIKGRYWEDGKGCAVGCTIHSGEHAEYEDRFGIPQALARLEDCIFEGMPNERAKAWPRRFMSTVRPGADLSRVQWHFLRWILTDEQVNPGIAHPLVRDAVRRCADVMQDLADGRADSARSAAACSAACSAARSAARSEARSEAESARSAAACSARSAAYSAHSVADSAAYSAADSARSAAACSAARSEARSEADSAVYSADSAVYSADSAAYSAADSAAYSARERAYVLMSDKLIELIKGAP